MYYNFDIIVIIWQITLKKLFIIKNHSTAFPYIDVKVYRRNGNFRLLFAPKFAKDNFIKIDERFSRLLYYDCKKDIYKKSLINYHRPEIIVIDIKHNVNEKFKLHKNIDLKPVLNDKEKSLIINKKDIAKIIDNIKADKHKYDSSFCVTTYKSCRNENFLIFYTNCKLCADNEPLRQNNKRYYLYKIDEKTLFRRCHC